VLLAKPKGLLGKGQPVKLFWQESRPPKAEKLVQSRVGCTVPCSHMDRAEMAQLQQLKGAKGQLKACD
jgi:hypothetical protein